MAQVTVNINGKNYKITCETDQEERLVDLATNFDRYVSHLHKKFGNIGDVRLMVMAGVMIIDEMTELSVRLEKTQLELETLRNNYTGVQKKEEDLVIALQDITTRIRNIAITLNNNPYIGTD
ncbi:hypothetical protein B488_12210 [Liberibacter crescens BT-1]|uniref:Cell division protein ZapA n=1 Tax=Liberibacter crescens (strain BT-1) TaxID=1215343 RepID=L0EX27_LIBCB|nr:cell division protein ZapA [Liberibacter crescens]AGA65213.1 hypothetical protein B488_12210 [Liberibacter crescens BT-1]AMC13163.1 hypothetical protein RL73_06175 [Liberibacter crescens]